MGQGRSSSAWRLASSSVTIRCGNVPWLAVVEGAARIEVDGNVVEAGPTSLLTFEPGERHNVASETGARILLILLRGPVRATIPTT